MHNKGFGEADDTYRIPLPVLQYGSKWIDPDVRDVEGHTTDHR